MSQTIEDRDRISGIDIHFGRFMKRLSGGDDAVFIAAAAVSSQARLGHLCIDIDAFAGKKIPDSRFFCPEKNEWLAALKASPVVGHPGTKMPMILEEDRWLYLYRYWQCQDDLAARLRGRLGGFAKNDNDRKANLKKRLDHYFPPTEDRRTDWQKIAAAIALLNSFSVISGGPGTGKTTTITKILALIAEDWEFSGKEKPLRIRLAAPTGKAAARLMASVADSGKMLGCDAGILSLIPDEAVTIHRLLGTIKYSHSFRYNEENKLPADVVVVDEASMVDIALMNRLVKAIPDDCRLILLGDQHQLASVEAGAVLADICNTGEERLISDNIRQEIIEITGHDPGDTCSGEKEKNYSGDCIAVLKKSYRFGDDSGIKSLSDAVNEGNDELFFDLAGIGRFDDIAVGYAEDGHGIERKIRNYVDTLVVPLMKEKDIRAKLQLFETFRILCAVRKGARGAEKINSLIEKILRKKGLIRQSQEDGWYAGRPVMITRNDYRTGLFNGDTGITVKSDDGFLEVCFLTPENEIRRFRPYSISGCETVFAMTVHKSQGSEFDSVLFLLPDRDAAVLTRELIYTGITRARKFVDIRGDKQVLKNGIRKKIIRNTGLRYALWG